MTARGEVTRTARALEDVVGAEHVLPDAGVAAYTIAGVQPAVVVRPPDEAAVSRALAVAFAHGFGVVPWGGGAHQTLGRPPARYDVALDLRALDRIVAYEPADMTATVQAGLRVADLERRLAASGQFWPLDPPLADQATVGGVVAANLNGPLRCRYGTVRDLVLGVRVAHADGTITKAGARVVKNATAYDLTKLYAGSYGTLGVLLEATLRLQPRPAAEQGWLLTGAAIEPCHDAGLHILGSHLAPHRVELLDAAAAAHCGLGPHGPALVVSFAGVREAVEDQGERLRGVAAAFGLDLTDLGANAETWRTLRDFPWRSAGAESTTAHGAWRGSVLPADGAKAMQAVQQAVTGNGEAAIAATVSHGVLRGVLRAPKPEPVGAGLRAAREALVGLGGFLVVTEASEAVRRLVDVWGPMPAEVPWMRQIRAAFDATGVLNPGRFIDPL